MEAGFLDEVEQAMDGKPAFEARPTYNRYGDCLVFFASEEMGYAERVDDVLTLYRSVEDRNVIGFQVKGIHALIKLLKVDGLEVQATGAAEEVHEITVSAILVTAMQKAKPTHGREMAYVDAAQLTGDRVRIPALVE